VFEICQQPDSSFVEFPLKMTLQNSYMAFVDVKCSLVVVFTVVESGGAAGEHWVRRVFAGFDVALDAYHEFFSMALSAWRCKSMVP
jgi:hypothetical protein